LFQALKQHFWFSVYIDGVEIVDGASFAGFPEDFRLEMQTDFPARMSVNSFDGTPAEGFDTADTEGSSTPQ
jgi:hypothetical protein